MAYGGTLSYDLKLTDPNPVSVNALALVGGGLTLYRNNIQGPFTTEWTPYDIGLTSGPDWTVNTVDGSQALKPDWDTVLGSLDALYIKGDWFGEEGDTCYLDNAVMTPEPGTLSVLALGGVLITKRRR